MSNFFVRKLSELRIVHYVLILSMLFVASSCSFTPKVKIVVDNTTDIERVDEMVEVDLAAIKSELGLVSDNSFVVYTSKRKEIPSQVTYDGKLIFQATIAPMSKAEFRITVAEPKEAYTSKVFGRQFPESNNDFTWENDMNAVRVYGDGTQQRAHGYDIWTKSTSELVVEERYKRDLSPELRARIEELKVAGNTREANRLLKTISLGVDHGNGLDAYVVGASLGGGAAALMERGSIIYPSNYTDYEILDNGPLRLTVKFTYAPIKINGRDNVVETRTHVVDAGTCYTKSYVSFSDVVRSTPIVAGIVMAGAKSRQATVSKAEGYATYADANRQDVGDGVIYVGTIFPGAVKSAGIMPFVDNDSERKGMGLTGHVVLIGDYLPKSEFVYYWGSMWAKYKIATYEEWVSYTAQRAEMLRNPLVVTMK